MGSAVIERDPVREDVVRVQALHEEQCLGGGRQPLRAFDLAHFGLVACPCRNDAAQGKTCEQVVVVLHVRGINGNRGDARVKHARNLGAGKGQVGCGLDAVVVSVNGHRHGDRQLVAERVHLSGHVPVVGGAVGGCAAFGAGNLDDQGGLRPLRSHERAPDHQVAAAIGSHRHGLAFAEHGPVYHLAADQQGTRVGKQCLDVRRTAYFKGFLKVCYVGHGSSLYLNNESFISSWFKETQEIFTNGGSVYIVES